MVKGNNRTKKVAEVLYSDPFRVIEMLVSVPLFVYGIYLLTPVYEPLSSSVFLAVVDGDLIARFTGVLYALAGFSMFFAAQSGRIRSRRVSLMLFFSAMLYSMMFRITEIGFTAMGILFIYFALVLAAVDYLYLHGWRQSSTN